MENVELNKSEKKNYTLKKMRLIREMSQKKLSELVGVSLVSINKYESQISCPSVKVALKIAKALNVRVEEIDW